MAEDEECPLLRQMRPRGSMFNSELATVIIGKPSEAKTYNIHKALLCHYCEFFKGAFEGGFNTTKSGELYLPETSKDVFDAFHSWIYTSRLTDEAQSDDEESEGDLLCKIWVFADMRGIICLKNAAIDSLVDLFRRSVSALVGCIPYIYDSTVEDAQLRHLVVSVMAWYAPSAADIIRLMRNKEPWDVLQGQHTFIEDLVLELDSPRYKDNEFAKPWSQGLGVGCLFHDHYSLIKKDDEN